MYTATDIYHVSIIVQRQIILVDYLQSHAGEWFVYP